MCVNGFAGGWPSIFYIFGAMGIVWFIPWMIFASKSPSDNRFISYKEREYIMENTKEAVSNAGKVVCLCTRNRRKSYYALLKFMF